MGKPGLLPQPPPRAVRVVRGKLLDGGTPRACLGQRDEVAPSLMPGESQIKLDISTHLSILGVRGLVRGLVSP